MKKKYVYVLSLTAFIVISWIYWSSNKQLNNTILFLRQRNQHFIKDLILQPSNSTCGTSPWIIIIVTSYVGHVELRSAHRRAMTSEVLRSMNSSRIFLLARIPSHEKYITQEAIKDESVAFGDILQGNFIENYRNLTLKHLMGLQWASTNCHQSSFILKVDDDTVFNLNKTYQTLSKVKDLEKDNFLIGYMLNNTKPKRDKSNKWYVTYEEYPYSDYPPYLSGWYYITTPNVAAKICREAIYHPLLWIDDILITGILAKELDLKLIQLPKGYWLEYYELLECCLKDMLTKFIQCDAVVGPNGGRNNLIYEFNDALSKCENWMNCTERPVDKPLNRVCVAFKDRAIFGDGRGEIENIIL